MTEQAVVVVDQVQEVARANILEDFGKFLRLHVADGDASPETLRSYHTDAGLFVDWCDGQGIDPPTASEDNIRAYRAALVEQYAPGTVAVKLAAIQRLYEAATWRGLRSDNPAAGLRAPKQKTARADRVKFLPLAGLRDLLAAPTGNGAGAIRDRAILSLMGRHGLRVSEVARPISDQGRKRSGLELGDVDLEAGIIMVTGKGRKVRTVYLTDASLEAVRAWLAIRADVADPAETALFVALDRVHPGRGMSARGIRYMVDKHLEALGLKAAGISCHSLRHSVGTWARAGGARLDALADLFGHASQDTTRVYSQIVDKMKENPARFLEAMLSGDASG